jgi:hypothetical protein
MSARVQLESLRAFVACEGRRGRPETASQLRVCIADHLHADAQLKAAVDAVLLCAYGAAPHEPRARIPPRAAVIEARPAPAAALARFIPTLNLACTPSQRRCPAAS